VAPASHGDGKLLVAGESDRSDDVGHIGTLRNDGRPPVDHPVPHPSRGVVAVVSGAKHLPAQLSFERAKGLVGQARDPRDCLLLFHLTLLLLTSTQRLSQKRSKERSRKWWSD
jgi:hypothetical protein